MADGPATCRPAAFATAHYADSRTTALGNGDDMSRGRNPGRFGTTNPDAFMWACHILMAAGVIGAVALAFFAPLSLAWLPLLVVLPAGQCWYTAHTSRGHEQEIRQAQQDFDRRRDAVVRRHPVAWAIAIPLLVVALGVLKTMGRGLHPSETGWLVIVGILAVVGVALSAYLVRHALRSSNGPASGPSRLRDGAASTRAQRG